MLNLQAIDATADRIENAGHIAMVLPPQPDADAMGSACALYAHLLRLQKRLTLVCATPVNARLACVPWSEKTVDAWDGSADLVLLFGDAAAKGWGIDPACAPVSIGRDEASETLGRSMLLYAWFEARQIRINTKMATALYAGLAEATQGFMDPRTGAAEFEAAAALARLGAETDRVNSALFLQHPLSALRLKGILLTSMQLQADGAVAVLRVTPEILAQTGADTGAFAPVLNDALCLPTVCAAVMLRTGDDGRTEAIVRTDGGIDVGRIAVHFGGAGQVRNAGFETEADPDALAEKIIKLIKKELE